MGGSKIPEEFDLNIDLDGDISLTPVNVNLGGGISLTPVNVNMDATMKLIGDPNQPVAATVELMNLPRFTLQDIKDLLSVRVQFPHYEQLCFKLFGKEIFTVCLSGEPQIITKPYKPNAYERCEICCPEDTRPFPDNTPTHDSTTQ